MLFTVAVCLYLVLVRAVIDVLAAIAVGILLVVSALHLLCADVLLFPFLGEAREAV